MAAKVFSRHFFCLIYVPDVIINFMEDIKFYFGTEDEVIDSTIKSLSDLKARLADENKSLEKRKDILSEKEKTFCKDAYVAQLKKDYEEMKKEYKRVRDNSFSISSDEQKKIDKWIAKHEVEKHGQKKGNYHYTGACGGGYSYIFTPTGLGTIGTIKCHCGDEFTFSEIS